MNFAARWLCSIHQFANILKLSSGKLCQHTAMIEGGWATSSDVEYSQEVVATVTGAWTFVNQVAFILVARWRNDSSACRRLMCRRFSI
jgi:hypothetical protein